MSGAIVDSALVVSNTAIKIQIPSDLKPKRAYITVETAAVRWRYDGKDPTGGVGGGHLANASETITVDGGLQINNFRIIRDTATDAHMYVTLEGQ